MKNFNTIGIHWKIRFLRGGGGEVQEKPIYRGELPEKMGGLRQFADLTKVGGAGLTKKRGVVFLRGDWYPNTHYETEHRTFFAPGAYSGGRPGRLPPPHPLKWASKVLMTT